MRHRISGNTLNRNSSLRKATIRDLAKATLIEERICTTRAKAKEARKMVEKLITLGKKGTLADKRRAFAVLCDHKLVSALFNDTALRFRDRVGGYTRIIHIGNRRGDNAEMAFLELTEKRAPVVSKPVKKSGVVKKEKQAEAQKETTALVPKKPKPATEKTTADKKEIKKDKGKDVSKKGLGGLKKIFKRKPSSEK